MKKLILCLAASAIVWTNALAQKTKVEITTEYGKIVMELYDNTPKHRDNFITLTKEHFFDSLLFHRCIPEFVIQGGDPNSKHATAGQNLGDGEHGPRIPAEINDVDYHKRGALGMARDNNPEKASSGCQFYIVIGKKLADAELDNLEKRGRKFTAEQRNVYKTQGGTAFLDGGYTVFGEVLEGMDVVEKIAAEPRNGMDRPNKDIHMLKMRILKKKKFLGLF